MSGIDYSLMERANQIVGEWSAQGEQGEERALVEMVYDAMVEARAAPWLATLDAARAEALEAEAWWRLCVEKSEWFRDEGRTHIAVRVPDGADLSCQATREDAMRAAIRALAQKASGA